MRRAGQVTFGELTENMIPAHLERARGHGVESSDSAIEASAGGPDEAGARICERPCRAGVNQESGIGNLRSTPTSLTGASRCCPGNLIQR